MGSCGGEEEEEGERKHNERFVRDILSEQGKYRAMNKNCVVRLSALSLYRSKRDKEYAIRLATQDLIEAAAVYKESFYRNHHNNTKVEKKDDSTSVTETSSINHSDDDSIGITITCE